MMHGRVTPLSTPGVTTTTVRCAPIDNILVGLDANTRSAVAYPRPFTPGTADTVSASHQCVKKDADVCKIAILFTVDLSLSQKGTF